MRVLILRDNHLRFLAVLFIVIALAGSCSADSMVADGRPTWGNSSDHTEPKPDSKGRAGHWWWPQPLDSGKPETATKRNGGRVFAPWRQPEETISVEPTPPCPEQPPPREPDRHLVLNNVLFPSDSADLTIWAKADLELTASELAWYFEYSPRDKIMCIGHTDDIGTESYNVALGLRRAKAVVDYLIAQGVDAGSLQMESVGESEPQVPNDTPQNRALNRCVEYRVVRPPEHRRFQPPPSAISYE